MISGSWFRTAGGQLHAVADQIVLIGVDRQPVDLAAMRALKRLQTALRHGGTDRQNSSSPDSSPISYIGKSTIQQNS